MEDDQDTLWAYCDTGNDLVEFGTVSLKELETTKGLMGLHFERDKFFDGCDYSFGELTSMSSIPTNLRRRKEGAA